MKKVAIIGAGPAGLAALRSLSKYKEIIEFVAFDMSDRVGGTWIQNDPHKPTVIYDDLRINVPKEIMAYTRFPFPKDIYRSFVSHRDVLDYLENFATHYQLHQYIQFRHRVEEVDPVVDVQGETEWKVTVRDCQSGHLHTEMFDYVLVCNGRDTVPLLPEIEGEETFTGELFHSSQFRSGESYRDKAVLILGAGPTGFDLPPILSPYANKVYLSHNMNKLTCNLPDKTEQVAGVERISNGNIILKDGNIVHADVIIYATGYSHYFPFLSKKCQPEVEDGHIKMIYKLMVDIRHPSLYYIGLNHYGISFARYSYQADYVAASIAGEVKLPTKEVMEREYQARYDAMMRKFGHVKQFHNVSDYQWTYMEMLARETQQEVLPAGVQKLYKQVQLTRKQDMVGYKDFVYRLTDDEQSFVILESQ